VSSLHGLTVWVDWAAPIRVPVKFQAAGERSLSHEGVAVDVPASCATDSRKLVTTLDDEKPTHGGLQ
jgi:hypothetical protein